jgi:hypothetical protein
MTRALGLLPLWLLAACAPIDLAAPASQAAPAGLPSDEPVVTRVAPPVGAPPPASGYGGFVREAPAPDRERVFVMQPEGRPEPAPYAPATVPPTPSASPPEPGRERVFVLPAETPPAEGKPQK